MSQFSLQEYHRLLSTFKEAGYTFRHYEEISAGLAQEQPFVVLRHDIDLSLQAAVEIARLEHELEVEATYFVLLRSPFYNLLSRANAEAMWQIHSYGHRLATHLDPAAYDHDCRQAFMEIEILSKFYPFIDTQIASFHSSYDLDHMPIESFPEIDRVYGPCVRGEVAYISDSTGRWRYGHPFDSPAFRARQPIQLLTHPIWWVQEGETAASKLDNWLQATYQQSYATLRSFLPKLFKLDQE
ncbi:MAG TPA: hypothetical protein VKX46_15820 [Ktedonobacteraceae bacterium]|nr:hypothetical protein [Ktedonobacteraceae bacterium]